MSEAVETCKVCGWSSHLIFRYHGGVPVEHPICSSCGGELEWLYRFDAAETHHTPEEMASYVRLDEVGFPEDYSPEVERLRAVIDGCLMAKYGSSVAITNAEGVVDVEVRPYVATSTGDAPSEGMKLIANVGRSVYSMALLELLAHLHQRLPLGHIVPHPSAYGVPEGVTELFPFGTEVGLFFQYVIPTEQLTDDAWLEPYTMFLKLAVRLAKRLAHTVHQPVPPSSDILAETAGITELNPGEFVSPGVEPMALESARMAVLDPLLDDEHLEEELNERIVGYIGDLGLEPVEEEHRYVFSLDSARVYVNVERRHDRLLVRYHAVILSNLALSDDGPHGAATVARLLTTLNDQIVFGRCVLEPLNDDMSVARVVLEKTLLAIDLDLSEFAVTLVVMAEEADRIDNFLQDGLGGLRADQIEASHNDDIPATSLEPVVRQMAIAGLPGVRRRGVEEGRRDLRHLLEEVRLPIDEHDSGDLAFTYGSSRIRGRVWEDERATYLTLRATVLREITDTTGLAEALNTYNRSIHFGAFALRGDASRVVEMVETILIDELSIEEFIHALVTLGELADDYDNILQDQFGGLLGDEGL